jgi:hypothetical protein
MKSIVIRNISKTGKMEIFKDPSLGQNFYSQNIFVIPVSSNKRIHITNLDIKIANIISNVINPILTDSLIDYYLRFFWTDNPLTELLNPLYYDSYEWNGILNNTNLNINTNDILDSSQLGINKLKYNVSYNDIHDTYLIKTNTIKEFLPIKNFYTYAGQGTKPNEVDRIQIDSNFNLLDNVNKDFSFDSRYGQIIGISFFLKSRSTDTVLYHYRENTKFSYNINFNLIEEDF